MSHGRHTGCPKKIARIRRTQKRFSGNIFLMYRVFVHIYLWDFSKQNNFGVTNEPLEGGGGGGGWKGGASCGGGARFGKKITCRLEDSKINCLHNKNLCEKNCLQKGKK